MTNGEDILRDLMVPAPSDDPIEQQKRDYLVEFAHLLGEISEAERGWDTPLGGLQAHVASIPPGQVTKNLDVPFLPPDLVRLNDNHSIWFDMAGEAGLQNPMLLWVEVPHIDFQAASFEERTNVVANYREFLANRFDIQTYDMVATGSGIVFMSAAGPQNEDVDITAMYGMRFGERLRELGKANKRDKEFLNAKGRLFAHGGRSATPDPDRPGHLTDGRIALGNPDTGDHGEVSWATYDVTATTEEFSWLNEDKHVSDGELYTSRTTAERMWRAATGKELPRWADRIQMGIMVPGGEPGQNQMIKGFCNIQPDRIWNQADHPAELMVSREGMAAQRGNNEWSMGRLKLYSAYREKTEGYALEPSDGLLVYPEIVKHVNEEAVLDFYEEEGVRQALRAPERGLDNMARRFSDPLLDPSDDGKLDPGNREYMRRLNDVIDRLGVREDAAIAMLVNQSPYGSPQVMREFSELGRQMRSRDERVRGALAPWISKWKGKRTSHEAYGIPEPERGYVTLAQRSMGGGYYSTALVLNRADAANPHVLARDGGPDNDDHYEAYILRDADGNYYTYAGRSPRDIDGGNMWRLTTENAEEAIRTFNLKVYPLANPDDPMEGGFIVPDAPDASHGMQDLYDNSQIKPEDFDPNDVQQSIENITDYDNWEVRKRGQAQRMALLAGNSSIGAVTNMTALANRSRLVDGGNVATWIIALSDLIDAEVQGTGTGVNMIPQIASRILDSMEEGAMVSEALMDNRHGIRRALVEEFAERYLADYRGNRAAAVSGGQTFVNRHVSPDVGLDARTNERVQMVTQMAEDIGKFHMLTADVDHPRWLTTARQYTANKSGYWITPQVKEIARDMTNEFSQIVGRVRAEDMPALMDRYGITWRPADEPARRVLRNRLFARAFSAFDQSAATFEAMATNTPNYRPGMLMAAVKQNQIMAIKALELGAAAEDAAFSRMTHERIISGLTQMEKSGYYTGGSDRPHLAITIAGNPFDTKNGRRWLQRWRTSTITYHDDTRKLGQFLDVVGVNDQHSLRWAMLLGYDLRFVDMVRGQSPRLESIKGQHIAQFGGFKELRDFQVGIFELVPNGVIAKMTPTERNEWRINRVRRAYRTGQWLPPAWEDEGLEIPDEIMAPRQPRDPEIMGVQEMTATMRTLPDGRRLYVDMATADILGEVPAGETAMTADLPVTITGSPEEVMDQVEEISARARQAQIEIDRARRGGDYMTRRKTIRPRRKVLSDAEGTLEALTGEAQTARGYLTGDFRTKRDDRMYLSGEVEHFVTISDVRRAAEDFEAWSRGQIGRIPFVSKALRAAKTNEEAAAAILLDVARKAEMRFQGDVAHGVWMPVRDLKTKQIRYVHSEGRTDQLRKHVNLTASIKVPIGIGTVDIVARHYGFASQTLRRKLMRWANDWQDARLFDGDMERMANASPAELLKEQARVAQGNISLTTKMYVSELLKRDSKPGQLVDIGVIGTVDDAFDYAVDFKNIGRQITGLVADASTEEINAYVRLAMRDGNEALLRSMGVPVIKYGDALERPESIQIRTAQERIAGSFIGADLRATERAFRTMDTRIAVGDWPGAWLEAKKLGGTHTSNFIKRHVHTYSDIPSPSTSLHGLGRMMFAVAGDNVKGVAQLNPIMTDATAQRAAGRMQFALNNLLTKSLDKVNKDMSRKVWTWRVANKDALPKALQTPADVRYEVWDQIRFEDTRYNWEERTRPGIRSSVVVRVKWWHLLLGAGGKMQAMRAITSDGGRLEKNWKVNPGRDTDDLCKNNGRQGWISTEESFRSGHPAPPAHPGCNCELEVRPMRGRAPRAARLWKRVTKPKFFNLGSSVMGTDGLRIPAGRIATDRFSPMGSDIVGDALTNMPAGISPENLILPEI